MPKLGDYLSSIGLLASELSDQLTDEDLEFDGPASDADYSRLALIYSALKTADGAIGEALDTVDAEHGDSGCTCDLCQPPADGIE